MEVLFSKNPPATHFAMFRLLALLFTFALLPCHAHRSLAHQSERSTPTPAQKDISSLEKQLKQAKSPDVEAEIHSKLAFAHAAHAREIGDHHAYHHGRIHVEKALELVPDHLGARKAEAWILLGEHDFQNALVAARKLVQRHGDDPTARAMVVDAAIEVGNFEEAETAAQWALDLDPGGVPGFTRAAYLREIIGDPEGAIELMQRAYRRLPEGKTEDRAWILTHIGHLLLLTRQPEKAVAAHQEALKIFADYHYAHSNLGKALTALGKHQEALAEHQTHFKLAPNTVSLYYLAEAQKRAGKIDEAQKSFSRFEKEALSDIDKIDNSNRELIRYYLDHSEDIKKAHELAKKEIKRRQDLQIRFLHARTLAALGKFEEAHQKMTETLAIGTRDPEFHYHAALIAQKANQPEAALKHLDTALVVTPSTAPLAQKIRTALQNSPKEEQ